MRIILSRKGFDSAAGGCPSPILPDGRLFSLPIPDKASSIGYSDIQFDGLDVGELVAQLTDEPKRVRHFAHLDPDLSHTALKRQPGWRPVLGQTGSAQGHLLNQKVQAGDIFIFFGSFRTVEKIDGVWRFIRSEPARHIIWGWLQVGEILKVDDLAETAIPWARYHPHFSYGKDKANTLYLAADHLVFDGQLTNTPGAGVFPHIHDTLMLTAPGALNQTQWRMPSWLFPSDGISMLSFHPDLNRWTSDGEFCLLKSAARGQEFVFDSKGKPEPIAWIKGLLEVVGH